MSEAPDNRPPREESALDRALQVQGFLHNIVAGRFDDDTKAWLSEGIAAYLRNECQVRLENCLHVPRNKAELARIERNKWLREAALHADASTSWKTAVEMAARIREFRSVFWPSTAAMPAPPEHLSALRRCLWMASKSAKLPDTPEMLKKIIDN